MKYLKYILGIILLLAIVFLILGMVKPTLSYDCEITVEKPVAESMAVMQDQAKMPEWLEGFQEIEYISGTPGAVGSVALVHFDTDGQKMAIKETITDIVPGKSISMLYESDFMDMEYKIMASPENGHTKITSNTLAKGNGMISKSIMALMGSSIKAQEETNLSNLKETIERNTKVYD